MSALLDDDLTGKVTPNTPGMTVHGPHTITFPPRHEWDRYCHDGHGGPPYRMFAVYELVGKDWKLVHVQFSTSV